MKRYRMIAVVMTLAMALCGCGTQAATESAASAMPTIAATPTPTEAASPTPVPTPTPSPSPTAINYSACWTKTPEEEADLEQRIQDFLNGEGLFTEEKLARNNIWDSESYQSASTDEFINGLSPTKLGVVNIDYTELGHAIITAQFELLDFVVRDGDICCLVGYQGKEKDENGELERHLRTVTFPREEAALGGFYFSYLDHKAVSVGWGSDIGLEEFTANLEKEVNEAILFTFSFTKIDESLTSDDAEVAFLERFDAEENIETAEKMVGEMWVAHEFIETMDGLVEGLTVDPLYEEAEIYSLEDYKQAVINGEGVVVVNVFAFDSSTLES